MTAKSTQGSTVNIQIKDAELEGFLTLPPNPRGIVLFAHGSGSSHKSPRNQFVARFFQDAGIGTLLFDLLTENEEQEDIITRELRFNIPFLAERLRAVTEWVSKEESTHSLSIGYFGASTGAAAAIVAAADRGDLIKAIVSRGGRPDLAGQSLMRLKAPTLLIVGGADFGVIELNEKAFGMMQCVKKLEIIPDATHLFEEPGTLEAVGRMANQWFQQFL